MKFKVGDRVRLTVDKPVSNVYVGYIGTVVDYAPYYAEYDMYFVEFTTNTTWVAAVNLELIPDEQSETVITKYVVIYERCDGSIVACDTLYDSKEQARQTFEAVYKPEVIVAIKEVSWVKK